MGVGAYLGPPGSANALSRDTTFGRCAHTLTPILRCYIAEADDPSSRGDPVTRRVFTGFCNIAHQSRGSVMSRGRMVDQSGVIT